ncbi:MAG: hypothetical protein K9K78_07590 [Spirochaetales bacterium]|nr:hypothetical protein [Spirochaetales bacterium]
MSISKKVPSIWLAPPLKLYEYAAADLPVISTALPALEHSRGSAYLMDDENLPDFSEAIDHFETFQFSKSALCSKVIRKFIQFADKSAAV